MSLGTIVFVAAPWDQFSDSPEYHTEHLHVDAFQRGCFTEALDDRVPLKLNHSGAALARTGDASGAFRLWQGEVGLFGALFLDRLPDAGLASKLFGLVAGGEIMGASVSTMRTGPDASSGTWLPPDQQGRARFLVRRVPALCEVSLVVGKDRRPALPGAWAEHLRPGETARWRATGSFDHSRALSRLQTETREAVGRHTYGRLWWGARFEDPRGAAGPNLLKEYV